MVKLRQSYIQRRRPSNDICMQQLWYLEWTLHGKNIILCLQKIKCCRNTSIIHWPPRLSLVRPVLWDKPVQLLQQCPNLPARLIPHSDWTSQRLLVESSWYIFIVQKYIYCVIFLQSAKQMKSLSRHYHQHHVVILKDKDSEYLSRSLDWNLTTLSPNRIWLRQCVALR